MWHSQNLYRRQKKKCSQLTHVFPIGSAMNVWQVEEVLLWNDLTENHTSGWWWPSLQIDVPLEFEEQRFKCLADNGEYGNWTVKPYILNMWVLWDGNNICQFPFIRFPVFMDKLKREAIDGASSASPPPPPIFYAWEFNNIHTCIADRHDHSVYYTRPPKMELLPTPMLFQLRFNMSQISKQHVSTLQKTLS